MCCLLAIAAHNRLSRCPSCFDHVQLSSLCLQPACRSCGEMPLVKKMPLVSPHCQQTPCVQTCHWRCTLSSACCCSPP